MSASAEDAVFAWVRSLGGVALVERSSFVETDAAGHDVVIRGLAASQRIAKGDVVLSVPYTAFFSAETVLTVLPRLQSALDTLRKSLSANRVRCRDGDTSSSSVSSSSSSDTETKRRPSSKKGRQAVHLSSDTIGEESDAVFTLRVVSGDEFIMAAGLIIIRGLCGNAEPAAVGLGGLAEFVESLPSESDLTNVDFWTPDALKQLRFAARIEKAKRRIEVKNPALFARLDRCVFTRHRTVFPESLFTASAWLWATHILGSRCFSYTPPPSTTGGHALGKSKPPSQTGRSRIARHRRPVRKGGPTPRGEEDDLDFIKPSFRGKVAFGASATPTLAAPTDDSDSSSSTSLSSDSDDSDRRETFTMVPVADLCNHSDVEGTCDFAFNQRSRSMVFRAGRDIQPGEQIYIRYNGMDAWKFAKYYGFVPQLRKAGVDCFPVEIPPIPPAPPVEQPRGLRWGEPSRSSAPSAYSTTASVADDIAAVTKRQLFSTEGGGNDLRRGTYVTSKGPNAKLLGAMRLRFMTRDEMGCYTRAFYPAPLSCLNEWKVYAELSRSLRATLMQFATEEDKPLSPRAAVAHCVALRDRDVLQEALKVCEGRATALAESLYYEGVTKEDIARGVLLEEALAERRRTLLQKGDTVTTAGTHPPLTEFIPEAIVDVISHSAPKWRDRVAPRPAD